MLHPSTYLIRCIFLSTLILHRNDDFVLNMILVQLSNLFVIVEMFTSKSIASTWVLKVHTLTELTIHLMTICFLQFNTANLGLNYDLGYVIIAMVGLLIAISILINSKELFA